MNEPVKRRRKLNTEQLEVLELLHKFRFGSNDLFAQYFGKKDRSFVFKRLSILLEQGLIGKRFEPSYRLAGKPAAYYLTPAGARVLQEHRGQDKPAINIKAIYKDKTVSEQFVAHSLELFAIYNQLRTQYGDDLLFFTRTAMNREEYDYFPHPLPDAYIRLKQSSKHFFMDIFRDGEPSFVAKRRIKQYIKYDEDGDWAATGTDLPVVLAVCESSKLAKRVQGYMTNVLEEAWPDGEVIFAQTTKSDLLTSDRAIWRKINDSEVGLKLQDIL